MADAAAEVAIIGGGIVGLALALNLHRRGLGCRVYEAVPEVKELGVGITLLPHAMRELAALGLQERLEPRGIENRESCFFNRFGQLIFKEPRGRFAGYPLPELGMHRGRLHRVLYDAVRERLGAARIVTDHRCVGLEQDADCVTLHFQQTSTGAGLPPVHAAIAIGCDGVNSAVRTQFYPGEQLVFTGINTWRGVTRHNPILTGRSYLRVGSIRTGKIVIYPIIDDIDGSGRQLINWTTEIETGAAEQNDWNKPGRLDDFIHIYESWRFDWLDVAELIRTADVIFEYPMVDKDPIARWSFERVSLAGDAAHPMYPRGSNGSAQGLIDARVLADALAAHDDPQAALRAYEAQRAGPAAEVVLTNRTQPPDFINIRVEELTGDQPFANLDDFITQDELRGLSDRYKRIAGYAIADIASPGAGSIASPALASGARTGCIAHETRSTGGAMNQDAKKTALRMIPYGIYVLTADDGKGNVAAATVNWVTQTAFAPPLVVVGVKTDSGAYSIVKNTKNFVLNMLGKDHKGMAFTFFKPAQLADGKLSGQAIHRAANGAPILDAALAAVECKVTSIVEQGDHHIVVGEVTEAHVPNPISGRPDAAILEMKDLGDNVFYGG